MLCVSDRNSRLDNNSWFVNTVRSNLEDESNNSFNSATIKKVLLGIIVCWSSNDNVICISISNGCVCSCGEIEFARTVFCFGKILFYVVILNWTDIVVQLLDFFRNDIYCSDMVVLCEQDSEG